MAQEVVGAVDCRSHCCTDQVPGREEEVAVVEDCRTRCCTDQVPDQEEEVVGAAGYTPDFHIRRRGERRSLIELKYLRQAQRFFLLK